ncbi:thioesterase II family protein [Mycolicibacterium vaccae]|uniref:Thioesterase TesA n=1 Tax=Mycolicibacterium vaccae ATCC 25954 TaxID=1194972 RepID=K0V0Z4_MYCVA|nr:alpha/beta fold hydrolase [Mycolicibacterium vaccae]ANI40792.1 thioesterase [Mycolicibacterium vaccae 95051]EJZ13032.1 thioesterase [Mycolicibacterium vaccae ATCC 25954]MCV7062494.1 thioesterase [Mycolicibacterium vaccae]
MIGEQDQLALAPWIKRFPGRPGTSTIVFPHAGGAAAAYRGFASALSDQGVDTFLMQYPQRGERLAHPAPETITELAAQMLDAADWARLGPVRLFGHCMGALVGFEFARLASQRGVTVRELWASASQAPSTVAGSRPVPTTDREMLADIVDLGGTDARLLEDEDFLELLLPAVRADYQAFNRYSCGRDVRIGADIHVLGGLADHRVEQDLLRQWEFHTDAAFTFTMFDGGHFYLDDHRDEVAELVSCT